jgi:AraC-like DNA-binding protein
MFKIEVAHHDAMLTFSDWAKKMNMPFDNGVFHYPENYMKGTAKIFNFPGDLQTVFTDVVVNDDFEMRRTFNSPDWYLLQMAEFEMKQPLRFTIGSQSLVDDTSNRAGIYLTTCAVNWSLQVPRETKIRSIHLYISKHWLSQYLHISKEEDVFGRYLSMQVATVNNEPFDLAYRRLFENAFELLKSATPSHISLENTVMQIVERFFTNMQQKEAAFEGEKPGKVKHDDIMRLMDVEAILVKDWKTPPPTIPELAKTAAMSVSKLKMLFKNVYGFGIYEYFQKYSMGKAREILTTGEYSIKEVGIMLGYKNLSNFSLAFKKEFGILPSELNK